MRDPIDHLRSEGEREGPQPRQAFADELERELRAQHAMGRPAIAPSTGRDWRRPAIGWAVAGIVVVAVFFALRGTVGGQQVDTATSVTVSTTDAELSTTEVESPTTTGQSTATSQPEPPGVTSGDTDTTSRQDESTGTTLNAGETEQPTTPDTALPATTAPATSAPSTTTPPTDSPSTQNPTTASTDGTRTEPVLVLTVASRAGADQLSWTVEGPVDGIAGFEIEWVQGEAGGTASLIRDPATRSVTIDRPADGAVGYRVLARNAGGTLIAASEIVRTN